MAIKKTSPTATERLKTVGSDLSNVTTTTNTTSVPVKDRDTSVLPQSYGTSAVYSPLYAGKNETVGSLQNTIQQPKQTISAINYSTDPRFTYNASGINYYTDPRFTSASGVTNTSASNVTSGGTSSASSTSGGSYSTSGGNYADLLKQYYEQNQANLRAQQEAQLAQVQNAYNNNISALEQAYQNRLNNLGSSYDSTMNQLQSNYGASVDSLNQNAENQLREAYINRMMNERNLKNQLATNGLTGGASESVIASILNNYGTNRNNINTATQNGLTDLEQAYINNQATAKQNYNDALNELEANNLAYRQQMNSDLANGIAGTYNNLYSGLGDATSNYYGALIDLEKTKEANRLALQKAYATQAAKNSGSTTTSTGSLSNGMQNIVNSAKTAIANGSSQDDVIATLMASGLTDEQIKQVFANI